MSILLKVLIVAITLLALAWLVPGIVIEGFSVALVTAIVLGLLNLVVKPILVILTLPITIVTLGLFIFVINATLFLFAASFIEGFAVDGFLTALVGSLILSLVSAVANRLL